MYHAHMLPFDAIQHEQKNEQVNFSSVVVVLQSNRMHIVISITSIIVECVVVSLYRSRVVVKSQLWHRFNMNISTSANAKISLLIYYLCTHCRMRQIYVVPYQYLFARRKIQARIPGTKHQMHENWDAKGVGCERGIPSPRSGEKIFLGFWSRNVAIWCIPVALYMQFYSSQGLCYILFCVLTSFARITTCQSKSVPG